MLIDKRGVIWEEVPTDIVQIISNLPFCKIIQSNKVGKDFLDLLVQHPVHAKDYITFYTWKFINFLSLIRHKL